MSLTLKFQHHGSSIELPWGGEFSVPRDAGFRDASKEQLVAIARQIDQGQKWRTVVDETFAQTKPWLHKVITSPLRTAFFGSVLDVGRGPVLDIGAGWGQIALPLAATTQVVALEPVAERLAFIRSAARQDGLAERICFLETDYLETEFETKFAAICAIGVLEWAGAFQENVNPQERQRAFLRKTCSELQSNGSLVLGIENRIGLKYLLGCPDDHIGVADIACLPATLAVERWKKATGHTLRSFTYSPRELESLLSAAGYSKVEFFAAFPDYKLPSAIVPFGDDGATLNQWLSENLAPVDHNGYDGSALAPELIESLQAHYRSLAAEGVAHAFVPSFFVRAVKGG